jgi:hypothetical protein
MEQLTEFGFKDTPEARKEIIHSRKTQLVATYHSLLKRMNQLSKQFSSNNTNINHINNINTEINNINNINNIHNNNNNNNTDDNYNDDVIDNTVPIPLRYSTPSHHQSSTRGKPFFETRKRANSIDELYVSFSLKGKRERKLISPLLPLSTFVFYFMFSQSIAQM